MKSRGRIGLALILKVALVLAGVAGASAAPFAYITNMSGNNVSVIDTATNTVVATVAVGVTPLGVAVSPDGSFVYVTNSGSSTVPGVSVIATGTNTVVATVSVGSGPEGVAVSPDGSRVYVANVFSNTVSVIATGTNTVVATVPVGSGPAGVAVSPDGSRVYVANENNNTVSVIATGTNTVVATVAVGVNPLGVAVSPGGSRVYVSNFFSNTISVIATGTNTVVATVPVGSGPEGVAVTPDGSRVYVATQHFNTVWVIATATNTVVATVPVGFGPIAFGKFIIGGKPDPLLIVPHWYQAGIPGATQNPPPPTPPPGWSATYPGNFWATDTYDDHPIGSSFTIRKYGCALTTLTMEANFWANRAADPMGFSSLDPRQMNHWTGIYATGTPGQAHTFGNVDWNNFATASKTNPAAPFVRMYSAGSPSTNPCASAPPNNSFPVSLDTKQTLDNLLRNGAPVILPIFKATDPNPQNPTAFHFVVVTGKDTPDNTYFVNDPGAYYDINGNPTIRRLVDLLNTPWGRNHNLSQADIDFSLAQYNQWKVYVGMDPATGTFKNLNCADPSTAQALGVYSNDPVEFILTDPQGRRTGFNPVSNTSFQEIPTSAYSTAIYRDEQDFSIPDPPPFKALDMANQMAGQYTLDVIGTGSGNFTVEVRASDAAGNWIAQTYAGTTAPGVTSRVTFQGGVTTFAAYSANVAINNTMNQFAVGGQLTLGAGSSGIDPLTQPVTLQVGAFSITIPAGSFQLDSYGNYVFLGTINGVQLAAGIQPQGGNNFAYGVGGQNANNLPTANPVGVRLAIGSNGGDTSVNANFLQ